MIEYFHRLNVGVRLIGYTASCEKYLVLVEAVQSNEVGRPVRGHWQQTNIALNHSRYGPFIVRGWVALVTMPTPFAIRAVEVFDVSSNFDRDD
jgi:hypothetical protein